MLFPIYIVLFLLLFTLWILVLGLTILVVCFCYRSIRDWNQKSRTENREGTRCGGVCKENCEKTHSKSPDKTEGIIYLDRNAPFDNLLFEGKKEKEK